jgi:Leucine-rich repeat (LRR) protein
MIKNMKSSECILRKIAVILALSALAAFPLEACASEPKPAEEPAVITMTTAAPKVAFYVTGSKDIAIDWGDGKKSDVNDAYFDALFERFLFSHDYSDKAARKIVIIGNVTRLTCVDIGLTALDVSRNTTLIVLDCSENQLTALDVSRSAALTDLDCSLNQLTALDVSRNTALERLRCNHNQITGLDMSKNTALWLLYCAGNQLTAAALNGLFRTLPSYPGPVEYEKYGDIRISFREGGGNPGYLDCDRSIAEKKGWGFSAERE